MNCKPGDLAIVVSVKHGYENWAIGQVTRCVRFLGFSEGREGVIPDDCWEIEPLCGPLGHVYSRISDSALRPIRDPGDDAIDEMVLIVGKPSEVTA